MKPKTITIEAVILNITRNYAKKEQKSTQEGEPVPDNELYEAARGTWRVGKDGRDKVEYALAVFDGEVVGVYRIKQPWNQDVRDDKWAFERQGTEDPIQKEYKGYKIDDIDGLKMGRNPVRYVHLECSIKVGRANK